MMHLNNVGSKFIFFLLNPFLSAVYSLKNIRDGISHRFLYLWFIMFGIGFCANVRAFDSFRYVEKFYTESRYSFDEYIRIIQEYFCFESDIKDIYTISVNFLVGIFTTTNYHWTYFIYALVFGVFYIKSVQILLRYNIGNKVVLYALLFMLCFSNPIFNINGVRFWTAAWIGCYVLLNVVFVGKKKSLALLLLLPLIHASMIIWIAITCCCLLFCRFRKVSIVLFVVSSFVSAASFVGVLENYSDILPPFLQNLVYSYTQSSTALDRMNGHSEYGALYADILNALPKYFHLLLGYLLVFNQKSVNRNNSGQLLTIYLLIAAVTNFLSGIPSVGRFQYMTIPFLAILWAKNYCVLTKYNRLFYLVPLLYAYNILYWCRYMSGVTELGLYLYPAPVTIIRFLFLV